MTNTPPKHDPNRPKPRADEGAKAEPQATPQTDASNGDDAALDDAAAQQDAARGGLGELARGGYADHEPKTKRP